MCSWQIYSCFECNVFNVTCSSSLLYNVQSHTLPTHRVNSLHDSPTSDCFSNCSAFAILRLPFQWSHSFAKLKLLELTFSVSLVYVLGWILLDNFSPQSSTLLKTRLGKMHSLDFILTIWLRFLPKSRDFALKEEMCEMWVLLCFKQGFCSSFLSFFWTHTLTRYMRLKNISCFLMLSIFYLYRTFKKKRKMFPAVLCLDYISKA